MKSVASLRNVIRKPSMVLAAAARLSQMPAWYSKQLKGTYIDLRTRSFTPSLYTTLASTALVMASHPTLSQARTHIEGFLEYTFTDIDWLEEALWAYPIILADGRNLIDGNKSLAVVGDAALQLVVANECYGQRMTRGIGSTPEGH